LSAGGGGRKRKKKKSQIEGREKVEHKEKIFTMLQQRGSNITLRGKGGASETKGGKKFQLLKGVHDRRLKGTWRIPT